VTVFKKYRNFLVILIAAICLPIVQNVCALDTFNISDKGTIFSSDSILDFTLKTDLSILLADRGEDPSYQKGSLSYLSENGDSVQLSIKLRLRGNFRKRAESCDFPPLKLKFDKKEVQGTLFEGLPDIKTVSHCQTWFPEFEQYVLLEYLIYKLYSIYTDYSFKVRLVRFMYLSEDAPLDSLYHYAFFLENAEDMAERSGGRLLDFETISPDLLDRDQLTLVALFNYMIINTDYSVPILHNLELVFPDNLNPALPVPYDFDWSGMINIPYNYNYNEGKGYPQREFKGPCRSRRELKRVITKMKEKRSEVFNFIVRFPFLNSEIKTRIMNDLNVFYLTIEDRKLIREEFMDDCN
jgi:hypothetical protein